MKLKDMKGKYVFYTEIDLGDGDFLKMREPSIGELDSLNKAGEKDRVEEMSKLFPVCLADHSFKKDDGSPASADDVYKELKDSGSLSMEIITTWMQALPFNSRLKKEQKSETSSR
jgi:hypothetical protein